MSVFYQDINLTYKQDDDVCKISPVLCVYQGDYGLDIYFTIKKKIYKFGTTREENILNSYSGAFVDIYLINPRGEEIKIKNSPVVEDSKIKFTITKELTDEMSEIGEYKVQFRIGNADNDYDTSIFTIPPFKFKVKQRIAPNEHTIEYKYLVNEEGVAYADETGTYIVCLEN